LHQDLIDLGDSTAGDLAELGIDLWRGSLRNLTRSFSEFSVNTETTRVDPAVQHPKRLFRS
jgi:hypothetical protein